MSALYHGKGKVGSERRSFPPVLRLDFVAEHGSDTVFPEDAQPFSQVLWLCAGRLKSTADDLCRGWRFLSAAAMHSTCAMETCCTASSRAPGRERNETRVQGSLTLESIIDSNLEVEASVWGQTQPCSSIKVSHQ